MQTFVVFIGIFAAATKTPLVSVSLQRLKTLGPARKRLKVYALPSPAPGAALLAATGRNNPPPRTVDRPVAGRLEGRFQHSTCLRKKFASTSKLSEIFNFFIQISF
jgi:hypothetical protein